jgi:hypothetical protein
MGLIICLGQSRSKNKGQYFIKARHLCFVGIFSALSRSPWMFADFHMDAEVKQAVSMAAHREPRLLC